MAGLGTRSLTLTIGGTDYTSQVSSCTITTEDASSDFLSFASAASGGSKLYKLKITAAQDLTTTALWDKCWSASGTIVAFLIKPYGNVAASVSQPHYSGWCLITEPSGGDFIGGDADISSTALFTIDVEWESVASATSSLNAKPTKVTS